MSVISLNKTLDLMVSRFSRRRSSDKSFFPRPRPPFRSPPDRLGPIGGMDADRGEPKPPGGLCGLGSLVVARRRCGTLLSHKTLKLLAGGPGFEPRLTESESAVLPLNYPPTAAYARRRRRQ